jgi:hypothetical protein
MAPSADALSRGLAELRVVAGDEVPVINVHMGKHTAKELEDYLQLGVEHVLVELPTEPRDETLRQLDELRAEFAKLG